MLSGASDVIVIQSPDGEFRSSSFHVRFGSLQVLHSKEEDILIYVNKKKTPVTMKLSSCGDAYFILDNLTNFIIDQSNIKIEDNKNNDYYYNEYNALNSKTRTDDKKKFRSLFPSQNQISQLGLHPGKNEICYVCKTFAAGIQTIKAFIYLWPRNIKIVLVDIDGTITKSDLLGVVLPFFGKIWIHDDIIELLDKIKNNGYKLVYLTARAIFQSEKTQKFLAQLEDNGIKLPEGPVIMDPDGVFSSFRKGIINKTNYYIKILALIEISNLFSDDEQHFYAGFGNKEGDAIAYRYLKIPLHNIFIINTWSEVAQLSESAKKTYKLLKEEINKYFPVVSDENKLYG